MEQAKDIKSTDNRYRSGVRIGIVALTMPSAVLGSTNIMVEPKEAVKKEIDLNSLNAIGSLVLGLSVVIIALACLPHALKSPDRK